MGAHTGMLAFESPLLLSIVALLSGGIWLLLWTRTHIRYMLLLMAGWWLLCCYWGLLAVSAGPAPVLARGDIARKEDHAAGMRSVDGRTRRVVELGAGDADDEHQCPALSCALQRA